MYLPVVVEIITDVVEACMVDVLVLVTNVVVVIVLMEAARVVVLGAAVATLVLVVTTSTNSPHVTAVGYSAGEHVGCPLLTVHVM